MALPRSKQMKKLLLTLERLEHRVEKRYMNERFGFSPMAIFEQLHDSRPLKESNRWGDMVFTSGYKSLSRSMRRLARQGLVKVQDPEGYPRQGYRLTEKGKEAVQVIREEIRELQEELAAYNRVLQP